MPNSWLKGRQEQRQNKHAKRKHTTHTSGTTEPSQPTASRRRHVKDGLNTEKKPKPKTIYSPEPLPSRAGPGSNMDVLCH